MAIFPTFETALLYASKALGITTDKVKTTKSKSKFKNIEMSLGNQSDTMNEIINNIADALELDDQEKKDLIFNFMADYNLYKSIEKNVYTHQASQRRVIWEYLARMIVPTMARHTVFWQIGSVMDVGMPKGIFWYLPNIDEQKSTVILPIPFVLNWLIDLIEGTKTNFAEELEENLRIYESNGTILKNLHNWLSGKNIPEIISINNMFSDEVKISFFGCFQPKEDSCSFKQALVFIDKKGLSLEELKHQINIPEDDLVRIVKDDCSKEEKLQFVDELKKRYQIPSMKTIRKRLLIARAVQESYEKLVKFLTPSVDKLCIDLNKNKSLQLIYLYHYIYNLTMQAHVEKRYSGLDEENKYFTENLEPYFRFELLTLVTTEKYCTTELVPNDLTMVFYRSEEKNVLNDIWPISKQVVEGLAKKVKLKMAYMNELHILSQKLERNITPHKQLNSTNNFDIVYSLYNYAFSNNKIDELIIDRLKELESNDAQSLKRIMCELQHLLIEKPYNLDTENKVIALLKKAYESQEFESSKALILRLEGLHLIAQNKLIEAEKNFNLALDECKKNSYGKLRGQLAKDAFAIAIANQKLIANNHEKYYRDMIYWDGIDLTLHKNKINIYDVSRDLYDYFWDKLYKTYPNYEAIRSSVKKEMEIFNNDFADYIHNKKSLAELIKDNKARLKKQLKYPQSDSIIMLIVKMYYDINKKIKISNIFIDTDIKLEISSALKKIKQAIKEIINEVPDIINIPDFKLQTPLMLAAHNKDPKMVEIFLKAGADPNRQDFMGFQQNLVIYYNLH